MNVGGPEGVGSGVFEMDSAGLRTWAKRAIFGACIIVPAAALLWYFVFSARTTPNQQPDPPVRVVTVVMRPVTVTENQIGTVVSVAVAEDRQALELIYAQQQFGKHAKVLFPGAPRFNEFVVQTSEDPYAINNRILGHKIVGGLPLRKFYPELGNAALWCCTELTTRGAIDAAVSLVAESEGSGRTATDEVEELAR